MNGPGTRSTAYVVLYTWAAAWLPIGWLINPDRIRFSWELVHPWAAWLLHGALVAHAWFIMIKVGKMAAQGSAQQPGPPQ
jgi:hypothetical protein